LGFSLAWRFTGLLALEASLRIQLASIIGSWRCTRSAVSAWNVFISCEYPCAHSLRPSAEQLGHYATLFSNSMTLGKYFGALRLAARLCGLPLLPDVSGILRGSRKLSPPRQTLP
jgi:hypothetical protein